MDPTSIAQLQNEIATLRATNSSLSRQIQILQNSPSCPRFLKFKELPFDIRHIIWHIALTLPHVHIIKGRLFSRSRVNIIMQTCREAREAVLRFRFPYFQVGVPGQEVHETKSYMNISQDVVWVPGATIFSWWSIDFYCSSCPRYPWSQIRHDAKIPESCQCQHNKLGCLALDYDKWKEVNQNLDSQAESVAAMWRVGDLARVYIVVNSDDAVDPILDPHVTFAEPRSPLHEFEFIQRDYPGVEDWVALSARNTQMMGAFKRRRMFRRSY
ncbi:uncharacterized protein LY89DRAFT_777079 [Mollisia scopiformis]|uniref:2EXR domain-containing protein n=1 Tax=Mollisia scopiformis TaxID=149040 RepID=A0A194XTC8_MOLSC|nr:uncharacterized protein LY89DRAFT_777079 [Mollisia scopiformis]KUJ23304.1 hypothetical protein LY89DRAFT_777079 [Mollisia scopiformis]